MGLVPSVLFNQRLWTTMLLINNYLPNPTVVYHDGLFADLDLVIKSLSEFRSLVVAEAPEQPYESMRSHKPKSTILIANDPESLVPSLRYWPLWNGRSRVLVILEKEEYAHVWIKSLWRWTRAVNVAAMILPSNSTEEFNFFTWLPYQANDCTNVTQLTKIELSDLYPRKIRPPLHNCPFTAITSITPPYIIDDFNGLEPKVFHTVAKKLQLNATYYRLPPNEYVWFLFDDGKPTQALKRIFDNEVDLIFGVLTTWDVMPFGEYTRPYAEHAQVWWVPGERPASRATAIYRAFSISAWTLILIACLLLFITFSLIFTFEKKSPYFAFLQTVSVTVGASTRLPSSPMFLAFFMIAYMYSLHITTGYQSSLIIFLSDVPRLKAIETIEELLESNLMIQLHYAHKGIVEAKADEHPMYRVLLDPKRVNYDKAIHLSMVAENESLAVLGTKLPFLMEFATQKGLHDEYGYPLVKGIREPFVAGEICFCLPRGHPLYPFVNRYMQMLVEGGFVNYFISQLIPHPQPKYRQLRPFGTENVEGPFLLLLVLLAFSFVTWLAECLVYYCSLKLFKNSKVRRVDNSTNRVHRLINYLNGKT